MSTTFGATLKPDVDAADYARFYDEGRRGPARRAVHGAPSVRGRTVSARSRLSARGDGRYRHAARPRLRERHYSVEFANAGGHGTGVDISQERRRSLGDGRSGRRRREVRNS